MRTMITAAVFFAVTILTLPAQAHTDEYFEAVQAPHGGQLRMTGPYHMELVAQDGQLTVYVTDHADNKISVEGGLAKATVEGVASKTQVHLHPVGDNMLKGSGTFALAPSTVVIVFMKLPNQDGYAARFMPLKPKPDPSEKPHEDATKSGGDEHHHHHHLPKH